MTKPLSPPKPRLADYEGEVVRFDDILKQLLCAKPVPKPTDPAEAFPTPPE